eukprot:GEMP01050628.1.p1 GENE.GEMP01050628.1~~GEMP01050628.1.p1  ORF type:complete len:414 (+),score=48.09 GEMP01050628.1:45-1244(+)
MAHVLNQVLKNPVSHGQLREMLTHLHGTGTLRPSDFRVRYAVFQLRATSEWPQVAHIIASYNFQSPVNAESRVDQLNYLTRSMQDLDTTLQPTPDQYKRKQVLVDKIVPLLERKVGGSFQTFGSCENGFWMRGSDVDSCLVLPHCSHRLSQLSKLRLVQAVLQRANAGTVEVVPARVPVAKLYSVNREQGESEQGDVTVNNTAALENSKLVATLSGLDDRIRPLGRVLKHWATQRQINSRSQGTLSTYTIILQLFYLMQTRHILPKFADIAITEHFELPLCDENGHMRPPPFNLNCQPLSDRGSESIGSMFMEFFRIFGDESFHGGKEGITIDDAHLEPNDLGVLVMKCPLSGKNVNPMTIEVWQAIHNEFARAKLLLENGAPLDVICDKASEPPISRH